MIKKETLLHIRRLYPKLADYFCQILADFEISWQIFSSPQCQLSRKLSSGIRADTCGQMDLTELIGTSCDYGKAPKN